MTDYSCAAEWMALEESVKEKVDQSGNKWRKVYFGGGSHFQNWLEQYFEVYGEDNIEIEEVDSCGLVCFEGEKQKPSRIWARIRD